MRISRTTTADQFMQETGWSSNSAPERQRFRLAYDFFVRSSGVPLSVLNRTDSSSPWGPKSGVRTTLYSWLQAIRFSSPLNPRRTLTVGQRLKQFRWPGEPWNAQGDWFTWESTRVGRAALPDGQTTVRIFEVRRPIVCLETEIADAFTGWAGEPGVARDYHHGGAKQLFIYRRGSYANAVQVVGGAR